MIIAISTVGPSPDDVIDPRFGRAEYFVTYDDANDAWGHIDNTEITQTAHGAGPMTAQKIADAGAQAVITGNGPGGNAARVLQQAGVQVVLVRENVTAREAVGKYQKGKE